MEKLIDRKLGAFKNIESHLWLWSVVSLEVKVHIFLTREERTSTAVEMFVAVDYLLTDPAHAFATVGTVNFVATVSEYKQSFLYNNAFAVERKFFRITSWKNLA